MKTQNPSENFALQLQLKIRWVRFGICENIKSIKELQTNFALSHKCPFVPFTWDSSSRNGTKAVKIRSLAPWCFWTSKYRSLKIARCLLAFCYSAISCWVTELFTFFPARPTREGLEYEEEVFPDVGWSRDRRSIDHVRDSLFFLLAPPLTH